VFSEQLTQGKSLRNTGTECSVASFNFCRADRQVEVTVPSEFLGSFKFCNTTQARNICTRNNKDPDSINIPHAVLRNNCMTQC